MGKKMASKATRAGVAERVAAAAGPKRIAVERARITSAAERRGAVARPLVTTATHPDANTLALRPPGPGSGKILRLVRRDERHAITRCPRVQDVRSSCRPVQGPKDSAGKRLGTAGATLGNAPRQGAFAEAAVLCLSDHPAAQTYRARLANNPGTGKALPVLAQQVAGAVYSRRQHQEACARAPFCPREGRSADEPGASRANHGMHLPEALATAAGPASVHAKAPIGQAPLSPAAVLGPPLSLLVAAARGAHGLRGLLRTRAWR
jgi:hypothetical protein